MNKTTSINLGGLAFNIDEEAYVVLETYLDSIDKKFSSIDKEILKDIEARIAEILTEKITLGHNVVSVSDIESVISIMGTANEIAGDEEINEQSETTDTNTPPKTGNDSPQKMRKAFLFRDVQNGLLGGIAAGIAARLDLDVTIIRIIIIILSIISLSWAVVIYLILWAIVPKAITTTQRMQMYGIDPSVENIHTYSNDPRFNVTTPVQQSIASQAIRWILKAILIVCAGIAAFAIIILLLMLTPVLFSMLASWSSFGMIGELNGISITTIVACIISLLALIIIPIILIAKGIKRVASKAQDPISWKRVVVLSVIWVAALLICVFSGLYISHRINNVSQFMFWNPQPSATAYAQSSAALIFSTENLFPDSLVRIINISPKVAQIAVADSETHGMIAVSASADSPDGLISATLDTSGVLYIDIASPSKNQYAQIEVYDLTNKQIISSDSTRIYYEATR